MRQPELSLRRHGEKRSAWVVYIASAVAIHGLVVCSLLRFDRNDTLPRDSRPPDSKRNDEMAVEVEYSAALAPSTALEAQTSAAESVPAAPPLRVREAESPVFRQASRAEERVARGNDVTPAAELTGSDGTDSAGRTALQEPEQVRPLLSLDQLGIGNTNVLAPLAPRSEGAPRHSGRRERSVAQAEAALQSNIAESITRLDQYHGLGPEGPVLVELVELARTETTPANSHARFEFATDAQGHLLKVTLLQSSSDQRPWQRIAQSVYERLRGQKLRLARTGRGATFTIKVEVRTALPSGADPGFAVNVLGIPIKKGAGPRSARADILNLNPMALTDPSQGSFGAIVQVRGDLVDIGAQEFKQAHAHLESIRINGEVAPEPVPTTANGGAGPHSPSR